MNLAQIIDHIYPLPQASKEVFMDNFTEVSYPRKHVLLRADRIEQDVYFIKNGIVRAFVHTPENEVTFWFGKAGDPALSMKSYVSGEKGYETIDLMEDCDLYKIDHDTLQELFQADIHIANWGRKFAEIELVKLDERTISRQFRTATERYKDLIEESPEIVQRVQLQYIASYLGITQVSLSRIRAELR